MFTYFPDNYPWSLAVLMSLTTGGQITEIDEACRPLLGLEGDEHAADEAWAASWLALAERVEALGRADEAGGHARSAGRKLKRAANYLIMAERVLPIGDARHVELYGRAIGVFKDAVALCGEPAEWVTLDTGHGPVPAIFIPAGVPGPAPCVITINGLDAYKEFFYLGDTRPELVARGMSVLLVDQPGVGEALRFNGLTHHHDVEVTVGAAIDWLTARADVDGERIGLLGPSLGGYYGVRAAAREPRVAALGLMGAIWDFGGNVRRMLGVDQGAAELPSVPELAEALQWFFGVSSVAEVVEATAPYKVEDLIGDVRCPLLIVHGENDRQITIEDARRVYDGATGTADRELRVFTAAETSSQHCGIDNQSLTVDYLADWFARRLGAATPAAAALTAGRP
jgi:pimeloyl-ACP methyl ester carboxylesterase